MSERLGVGGGLGLWWRRGIGFDGVGNGVDWNGFEGCGWRVRLGRRKGSVVRDEGMRKGGVEMGRVFGEAVAASLGEEKLK